MVLSVEREVRRLDVPDERNRHAGQINVGHAYRLENMGLSGVTNVASSTQKWSWRNAP